MGLPRYSDKFFDCARYAPQGRWVDVSIGAILVDLPGFISSLLESGAYNGIEGWIYSFDAMNEGIHNF